MKEEKEESEIGGGNLKKLAAKAVKRVDADVDGDVDSDRYEVSRDWRVCSFTRWKEKIKTKGKI